MARLKRTFEGLLWALFLLLPLSAGAHAVVTASSLQAHPVRAGHATEVSLIFNSTVELKLSKVFWVSAGDVFHPAEIRHGKKPGELLIRVPALEPGEYAIKYKVFAADGHLTESTLRFHVAP